MDEASTFLSQGTADDSCQVAQVESVACLTDFISRTSVSPSCIDLRVARMSDKSRGPVCGGGLKEQSFWSFPRAVLQLDALFLSLAFCPPFDSLTLAGIMLVLDPQWEPLEAAADGLILRTLKPCPESFVLKSSGRQSCADWRIDQMIAMLPSTSMTEPVVVYRVFCSSLSNFRRAVNMFFLWRFYVAVQPSSLSEPPNLPSNTFSWVVPTTTGIHFLPHVR